MPDSHSFDKVWAQLEAGDEQGAIEIFNRFARRLVGLAQSRLDPRVRRQVDAEDILQSAFKSFFRRQANDEFELQDWDSLWSLLVVITIRKCGRRVESLKAARRDVRREVHIQSGNSSAPGPQPIDPEPTPEEAMTLAEMVDQLLVGLDEHERQIVSLRLQGLTAPEISDQVGYTERTVHRVLARSRKRIEKLI